MAFDMGAELSGRAAFDRLSNLVVSDGGQLTTIADDLAEVTIGSERYFLVSSLRALAALAERSPSATPDAAPDATINATVILVGLHAADDHHDLVLHELVLPASDDQIAAGWRSARRMEVLRRRAIAGRDESTRVARDLSEIIAIAHAIASERDIRSLLGLILEKTRGVTGADAGSVYIVEGLAQPLARRTLRFMVSQNDSKQLDFSEFSLPLDARSIVGRAALGKTLINIADLYELDQPGRNRWGFRHDKTFDRRTGYEGHSMLTVPMANQRDEVIGVIQLINKRVDPNDRRPLVVPEDFRDRVTWFEKRDEDLALTLATQAGISLENTLLYEDIRRLFEGFVQAAVTAIEARDPTTSGHSSRVAVLTTGLAEMVDREAAGPYAEVSFSPEMMKQIEYAALLHDFGKVGVREKVLVKAKKLYEPERDLLMLRFDYIRGWRELEAQRKNITPEELQSELRRIDDFITFILRANEPTVLPEGSFERLEEIAQHRYQDPRGEWHPYLRPEEIEALRLPRGSLTSKEREEIESHVVHTYAFLETIPWGRRFAAIPEIAGGHHEKLDGTGYPHRLRADQIRIETRMMTIADIFDALTASDRPYKKAVPLERALDILEQEIKGGKCDPELFRIFVDSKLWQRVLG